MADKSAQVKIGHYILGETLGVGTFGKVKSKLALLFGCGKKYAVCLRLGVKLDDRLCFANR